MSEIKRTHQQQTASAERPFADMHTELIEARKELLAHQEQVSQVLHEAALLQARVNSQEAAYRSRLEEHYIGDDGEGRTLRVNGGVDAVVKRDEAWVFEEVQLENASLNSVRMELKRFNPDIHDIYEYAREEATIVAQDLLGNRYYVPESSITGVGD